MGLSRDSMHKRRHTGGKRKSIRKKRKFMMARPPAMTKIGPKRVHIVRCRGGNRKFRAMRLDAGNFSWGSEAMSRKTRILDVVYNASNNELVRTKTLVKNTIVLVDAAPFKQWYQTHYGISLGKKKGKKDGDDEEDVKQSKHVQKKLAKRAAKRELSPELADLFKGGRLLAAISSRPGQSGRADGYILEGPELSFYRKKLRSRKK
eukprot:g673.t1